MCGHAHLLLWNHILAECPADVASADCWSPSSPVLDSSVTVAVVVRPAGASSSSSWDSWASGWIAAAADYSQQWAVAVAARPRANALSRSLDHSPGRMWLELADYLVRWWIWCPRGTWHDYYCRRLGREKNTETINFEFGKRGDEIIMRYTKGRMGTCCARGRVGGKLKN